jgi:hypothetical protein
MRELIKVKRAEAQALAEHLERNSMLFTRIEQLVHDVREERQADRSIGKENLLEWIGGNHHRAKAFDREENVVSLKALIRALDEGDI